MRGRLTALFAAVLAGCASAPIVTVGDNEYEIAAVGKDALHRDSTNWQRHFARAQAFCRGRGQLVRTVDRTPSDGNFHFGCIAPPPPPPPPPAPPPSPAPATEAELDAGRVAWRACLEAAEPPIDDMISDANTVATVLATRCSPEFAALLQLTQKGHSLSAPASAFAPVRHRVALDIVLRERAQRRSPKAAPPPVTIPRLTPEKL